MLTDQIADLLKTARKDLGFTQKELARRAGVSHRLWAEVERGERPNVSLETALRMLSEVGVGIRLTDPRGTSREIRGPGTEAAARAARAVVRRATWQGRQIRLDQEGQEGQASPAAARAAGRLGAVTRVSEQAFAVARSRAAGTRGGAARPSARSSRASTKPAAKSSTRPSAGARR